MTNSLKKTLCSLVTVGLLFLLPLVASAANTKTTVSQVTATVTLTDDVDYIVSSETPFGDAGVVNIENTDHAVLILSKVKPSAAKRLLAAHVQINGVKAVDNSNCQVKLYNLGCIIMPYSKNLKPLTVYSEPNFEGESCNDFGLENDGGYMNTMTEAQLNNRISSFKLKRGYMVTFANRAGGRGYSRCFIAADKDLEIATLPGLLDNSISSYRVFKWYDAGKKQLANDLNTKVLAALNVQSSYTWSEGHDMAPDYECVPNHIYEDYPSSSAIGKATWSPHTKNNNEPRNSSDDHPQDLNTILDNWENMMRTGLRLCSPASWDGSDYWNATGFLADFLDAVDARGWRCDIIDLHCYWPESNFGNIANWANKYNRPVWISEWCWGASWGNNNSSKGAFADGVTEIQVRDALQRICTNLNNAEYVERYFYWNGERDPSHLYKDGKLTPAGEMYAKLDGGLAYNGKYDYVPKVPKQYDPSDLAVSFDKETNAATLTWHDYNGELNSLMEVQRRANSNVTTWETIASITLQEEEADYQYVDEKAVYGCQYRIHIKDANNFHRYSKNVTAASDNLEAGDGVNVNGVTKYLGGNVILNGEFDMGSYGWTNGQGQPIGQPWFQVVNAGGADGGFYLQAYGHSTDANSAMSVKTIFDVEPGCDYYVSGATCNTKGNLTQFSFSEDGSGIVTTPVPLSLINTANKWNTQFNVFNTDKYSKIVAAFRSLNAVTQIDQLLLARLFDNRDDAIADGIDKARQKAAAFCEFNQLYPNLNSELQQLVAAVAGTTLDDLRQLEEAVSQAIMAYYNSSRLQQLIERAEVLYPFGFDGHNTIYAKLSQARAANTAAEINECYVSLEEAIDGYLTMTDTDRVQNPSFTSALGWTTKCGTYTDGDQRINSKDGITFWNAWWSGLSASEGTAKTMEIKQEVKLEVNKANHGLYALQCRAMTEHNCLSDQHGYLTDGTQTVVTPTLTANYYDLPSFTTDEYWQTLTTVPIYVEDGSTLTLGFTSSKQGAVDGAWVEYGKTSSTKKGDLREGWWGATDFRLLKMPFYHIAVTPDQWGVRCLPYNVKPADDMQFYKIAGITADYTQLCLEPIAEGEAGLAFIYKCSGSDARFLEYGAEVTKAGGDAPGNLRSFLKTTASAPIGYYAMQDGQWVKVTGDRPKIGDYGGIIRPLTDKNAEPLTVYEAWKGATMPIVGVTAEEIEHNEATAEHVSGDVGMKGDVNGDTVVDLADVVAIISFLTNTGTVSQSQADVNGDGMVDIADITCVLTLINN